MFVLIPGKLALFDEYFVQGGCFVVAVCVFVLGIERLGNNILRDAFFAKFGNEPFFY